MLTFLFLGFVVSGSHIEFTPIDHNALVRFPSLYLNVCNMYEDIKP